MKKRAFLLPFLWLTMAAGAAPSITRVLFHPPVVPENQVQPVRFEATITESPASVAFNYNSVDRPMFDNGTNGDVTAGDGVWTILFQPSEILSKNSNARVFRPFLGTCKPAGGGSFNVVAEVWTSAIGRRQVRLLAPGGQETDYVVNYTATPAQLKNFDAPFWAKRFYSEHPDKFDFLNFVLVGGSNGNRFHVTVRSQVQGISTGTSDNSAGYGSASRLQGYTQFPISSFFDGGNPAFNHEVGHQWINFCHGTSFASGIPHWPRGNIAINVMGFSISGSVGGTYSYTFTSNGQGGYTVGAAVALNQSIFNSMELYLMGLVPPAEVATFFVLANQAQVLSVGQLLTSSEVIPVTVSDVIAARGVRVPNSAQSQKTFRCATVVLSEALLENEALSFYDWFARRAEAKQPHLFADGLATGTSNPWYVATGGRSVMFSRIRDDIPTLQVMRLPSDDAQLSFLGKPGIRYQAQSSIDFAQWNDEGGALFAPLSNPPGDGLVEIVLPILGALRKFYRLTVTY